MKTRFSVLLLLALSSCAHSPTPAPAFSNPVVGKPVWQTDPVAFGRHMDQVKAGWTTKQLAVHAGEPKGKSDSEWYYQSAESPAYAGIYRYCLVLVNNGVITEVRQGDGFVPDKPPLGN